MRNMKEHQRKGNVYPVTTQHLPGTIHANGSDHTRFCPKEPVIKKGNFHEELAEGSCLEIIIVSFGNSANPRIRGAIRRNTEIKGLEDDAFALENLIPLVAILGHEDKLINTNNQEI